MADYDTFLEDQDQPRSYRASLGAYPPDAGQMPQGYDVAPVSPPPAVQAQPAPSSPDLLTEFDSMWADTEARRASGELAAPSGMLKAIEPSGPAPGSRSGFTGAAQYLGESLPYIGRRTVGEFARALQGGDPEDVVKRNQGMTDSLINWADKAQKPDDTLYDPNDKIVQGTKSAVESMGGSISNIPYAAAGGLVGAGAGSVIPGVGTTAGGFAGAMLGSGAAMKRAEEYRFMEGLRDQLIKDAAAQGRTISEEELIANLSDPKIKDLAAKSGWAEAGFESAEEPFKMAMLGFGKKAIEKAVPAPARVPLAFVGNMASSLLGETGTDMVQKPAQEEAARILGLSTAPKPGEGYSEKGFLDRAGESFSDVAAGTIAQELLLGGLFSLGGKVHEKLDNRSIKKAAEDWTARTNEALTSGTLQNASDEAFAEVYKANRNIFDAADKAGVLTDDHMQATLALEDEAKRRQGAPDYNPDLTQGSEVGPETPSGLTLPKAEIEPKGGGGGDPGNQSQIITTPDPVTDVLSKAGVSVDPAWQQAQATVASLQGGQQSVESALGQNAAPVQPQGVPGQTLAPVVDAAWNDPVSVDARYQQRIADARAQAEAQQVQAQAQAEADRAANAAPFPASVESMNGMAQPAPVVAEPATAPPAPKVLSAKEQKQAESLTKKIDNLTKRLAVEKNQAARARVEETRAGYEFELRSLTGETAPVLTPEEQARATELRQPVPALPAGIGFERVGEPYAGTQAENAAVEQAGIPAVDENALSEPMPAADSSAWDRSQFKSESDLIRDYQAGAIQEADARGNELLKFVRGRMDWQSVANHFGPSVLEDLRGRLGPGVFSKNGVSWDVLEAEAKSQGLLSQDASLVDALQNVLPAKRKTQEQASRGIINGQMEQNGYAAPMGEARQEPSPLPSDRMGIPEAEGLAPLNSDGTLTGDGPRYSIPPNLSPAVKAQATDLVKRIDNLNKMLRIEKNQAARLRIQKTVLGYEQQLADSFGAKPTQASQAAVPGAFPENMARPMGKAQNVSVPAANAVAPASTPAPVPAEGWKGHTTADISKAFPKSTVTETNTGHRVDLPNGRVLLIDRTGSIAIDRAAAKAGGYTDEQIDRANAVDGAQGQFDMVRGTGVIQLTEAGRGELGHEIMHFARVAALTPKQNAILDKHYAGRTKNARHLEEVIAQEYNAWLNKRSKDSTGLFSVIRKFFQNIRQAIAPTAEGVFEKVASGKAWGKETGEAGQAGPQYQITYQGSPTRGIERISDEYIGTGEGNGAFGYGHYSAQNKNVGEIYRDVLGGEGLFVDGKEILKSENKYLYDVAKLISRNGIGNVIESFTSGPLSKGKKSVELASIANSLKNSKIELRNKGQLYELDVPDSDKLLDWDKPFSEQPAGVREKLESGLVKSFGKRTAKAVLSGTGLDSGKNIYRDIARLVTGDKAASQYLDSIGIPGHQYLDGSSRGAGDGDRNVVTYSDRNVKITGTFYSLASEAGATADNVEDARRQWAEKGTDSQYFKKWLGDSEYLGIMLHGSPNNNLKTIKSPSKPWIAAFLAPMDASGSELASHFSGKNEGASVYPVHAKAKKIFDADNKDDVSKLKATDRTIPEIKGRSDWTILEQEKIVSRLKDLGYDAMYVNEGYAGGPENIAIFYPSQIKSATGNRGTFDAANPDIRYSLGTFSDPDMEARFQEARKGIGDQRSFMARVSDWLKEQKAGFSRHFIHMTNDPEFAQAHEILRHLEASPTAAQETAIRNLKKITGQLNPEDFDLFSRKVLLDDLAHEVALGHDLPFGFTPAAVAREKANLDQIVAASPVVSTALDTRKTIMDNLSNQLVDAGILTKEQLENPAYFRHEVLKYAREWQNAQGTGSSLKKPKPGYAKGREGSTEDINANYLEVEYAYMQRALTDLATIKQIEKIKAEYDIRPQLEKVAKEANDKALAAMGMQPKSMTEAEKRKALDKRYKRWMDLVPEGYDTFQVDKGLLYGKANIATDRVVGRLAEAAFMDPEDLEKHAADIVREIADGLRQGLQVVGKKPEIVLPSPLVATLNNLRPQNRDNIFDKMFSRPLGMWKQWQLINPRRVLKYNLNNMSGDIDAVIAGNVKALKKVPEAFRELRTVMLREGDPTQEYQDAVAQGVFDSGLSVQEIPDIASLNAFANLQAKTMGKLNLLGKGWGALQKYTQFRENILRYAAYKDYLSRLEAGESMDSIGYGAAHKPMVDALTDNKAKAALLARSLVGDYGAVSHYGQGLRNKVIPFYSWMEVNAKRYNRLIMNAFDQGIVRGVKTGGLTTAMIGARTSAYLGVRMFALQTLIQIYNRMFHGDDEDKLGELERNQLHLILGHDKDGNIHTLRLQGSMSDFLGWFGYADAVAAFKEIEKGRGTYGDVMKAVAKAPFNKIAGGMTPILKTPLELAMGKSLFPDVFNPRPINDTGRAIAQTVSAENEYDALADKATRGYWKSWLQAIDYSRNVGEIAFNNTQYLVREFKESKGIEGEGSSSTPKSRLIREYKLAQRYGDESAARKAMEKMQAQGITQEDVEKSLLRSAPLAGISGKDRAEFMARLTPKEQDQVKSAEAWYKDTIFSDDTLKLKYDFNQMRAEYGRLHKQERELSKAGKYAEARKLKMDNDLYRKGNLVSRVESIQAQRKKVVDSRLQEDEKARRLTNFDQRINEAMGKAMAVVGGSL